MLSSSNMSREMLSVHHNWSILKSDQFSGSIDIHVDRFGPDLIHSPSPVGVFEAEIAT